MGLAPVVLALQLSLELFLKELALTPRPLWNAFLETSSTPRTLLLALSSAIVLLHTHSDVLMATALRPPLTALYCTLFPLALMLPSLFNAPMDLARLPVLNV